MSRSPRLSSSFASISEAWLEETSGSVQAKLLEVACQGRVWDPQVCSNSSLGRAILQRDVPQFLAELFPVVSLWARFCNTFVAQVWRSDASVLLLLVEFPHGRNLVRAYHPRIAAKYVTGEGRRLGNQEQYVVQV